MWNREDEMKTTLWNKTTAAKADKGYIIIMSSTNLLQFSPLSMSYIILAYDSRNIASLNSEKYSPVWNNQEIIIVLSTIHNNTDQHATLDTENNIYFYTIKSQSMLTALSSMIQKNTDFDYCTWLSTFCMSVNNS